MITLILKNKEEIKFNLKTGYPREIDLCQTITSLQLKNSKATINIVTSLNNNLSFKIPEILDVIFNEAEYVKVEVHTAQEKPKEEDKEEDLVEKLIEGKFLVK